MSLQTGDIIYFYLSMKSKKIERRRNAALTKTYKIFFNYVYIIYSYLK